MIAPLSAFGTHSPEGVSPAVPFNKDLISGRQKFCGKFWVLGEFRTNDFLHDADFHILPVRTQCHVSSNVLALARAVIDKLGFLFLFEALLRLESRLVTAKSQSSLFDAPLIEIA